MNLMQRYKEEYRPYKLIKGTDYFFYFKTVITRTLNENLTYHYTYQKEILVCSQNVPGQTYVYTKDGMILISFTHALVLPDRALLQKPENWDEYVTINNIL